MFLIRILIIALVIGTIVWFVNNKILGKNLVFARVISVTLIVTGIIYLLLGGLSYLIEGN